MADAGARVVAAALLREARAGQEADREIGAGADEAQRVEVERVDAPPRPARSPRSAVPGVGGVGLVEAADVGDVPPERVERRRRLELGVDDARPGRGGEGRDRPGDRAVVDRS